MNNTEDKIENKEKEFIISEKFKFDEAFNKINLLKYISKSQDEMSKNSTESSMDEYDIIYKEDEVYLNLKKEYEAFLKLRADEFAKLKLNISQEERDSILNYIKFELEPRIEELEVKIDARRHEINLHRETYEMKSDDKKTRRKNTMLAFVAGAAGVGLVAHPKTRRILLNSGKNIAIGAVKNGMKVL